MNAPRIIVAGPRDWTDADLVWKALGKHAVDRGSVIICGAAPGADTFALQWAEAIDRQIIRFPADWKEHGRAAGPIRNQLMLQHGKPTELVAFQYADRDTRGTRDMINRARRVKLPTTIYYDDGGFRSLS